MDRQTEVTKTLLRLCPSMVSSESAVTALVMGDMIDFNTGMELTERLQLNARSNESDDKIPGMNDETNGKVLFNGDENFQFPDVNTAVVIKTVMALSSADEQKSFNDLLDRLNLELQSAYHKRRKEIIRSVSKVVELTPADETESVKIMEILKSEQLLFIKK